MYYYKIAADVPRVGEKGFYDHLYVLKCMVRGVTERRSGPGIATRLVS